MLNNKSYPLLNIDAFFQKICFLLLIEKTSKLKTRKYFLKKLSKNRNLKAFMNNIK